MSPAATAAAPPLLEVRALAKAYGSTVALADGELDLSAGQVLALMGENGSGKSTFVKILSGVQRPDAGIVRIDGLDVRFRSPADAIRAGVRTVFQEVLVAPGRSVLENIWLGASRKRGRPSAGASRTRAAELMEELVGGCDLDAPAGELSLSDRQALCIARAFADSPRVLVLDEATSALDVQVRDRLFAKIRTGVAAGMGVIFISHRMDEVTELADGATVFRNGRTVTHLAGAEVIPDRLVRAMTGGAHLAPDDVLAERDRGRGAGAALLSSAGVRTDLAAPPIDARFRAGEIVGFAGLEGHGQAAFLEILAGLRSPAAGRVDRAPGKGGEGTRGPRAQVAYLPRDRRTEGILPGQSILDNFLVSTAARDRRGVLLNRASSRIRFAGFVEELAVKAPRPDLPIESLSGGNQQKVILARWLATGPDVLLLNDPTRGVDIGAKRDIYRALTRRAERGAAIVVLSTEVDELLEVMDRVLVFREGGVFAELSGARLTRDGLVSAYFGDASAALAEGRS